MSLRRVLAPWRTFRQALSGDSHDHTSGSLHRSIVLLAIPMVLEMAMESVFAVCDIFFVARLGADAAALVGLTESLLSLLYAVAIGLSMGTTALVARRIGEGDPEAASRAGTQAIYLGVGLSAVIGVLGWVFAVDLLGLMGAEPQAVASGSAYTRIMLGANVVIMLLFLNNAIFRGAGDAVVAMRSLWIANGINLVLDPCLIFGLGPFPALGVAGAAIATVTGRGVGVLYQLAALYRGAGRIRLRAAALRWRPRLMVALARVSAGGVGQFMIGTSSWVVLMRLVAPAGSHALAGYTIAIRILMFAFLPSWGLSNAVATLVGQNLGAGHPDRAERSVWLTGTYNMLFLAGVTVVCLLLGPQLVGLFTSDAAVAGVAEDALRIISYGYVCYAWGLVLMQAFNGAGDTMTPTWINLICFWLVQIPAATLCSHVLGLGPRGVFWSVMGAESLLAVVSLVVFRRGKWRAKQV